MSKKSKLIVAALGVATVTVMVLGFLLTFLNQDFLDDTKTEAKPSTSRSASAKPQSFKPGQRIGGAPSEVCAKLAPQTLQAYITAPRDNLKGVWLTSNAQGLDTPISSISKQPLEDFSGALLTGSQYSTAVCNVWTGLESPWLLQFRYTQEDGWLATMVQGPATGAYDTSGEVKHDVFQGQ